jgi:hypothetical protein
MSTIQFETMDYETARDIAWILWETMIPEIKPCYVQKVSATEWRVCDVNASIRGYVDIQTATFDIPWIPA